jgi:P-type conjugative transfer protein TrbJ
MWFSRLGGILERKKSQELCGMRNLYILIIVTFMFLYSASSHAILPVIDGAALVQLGNQLVQLKEQTQLIKMQLEQLKGNQYDWSNAQGLINNLGSVVNQENSISYSASNINGKFKQAYPGYQPPQNFSQQYKDNSNMTLNTLNGVLQSMGTSSQDFQNENTRLNFLQHQSQSAEGQMQAIQAASQIASEMVSQIQILRQTVIAQTNAQTAYYATQVQNEASEKAELSKVISSGSTTMTAYGTSGHPLNPPS